MIEFEIRNIDRAVAAVDWCLENISAEHWTIGTMWPGTATIFTFEDSKMAEFFALKWL